MASRERKPVSVRLSDLARSELSASALRPDPEQPAGTQLPTSGVVGSPMRSLDLEDLGLEVEIGREQIETLLDQRVRAVSQVFHTITGIGEDLVAFRPRVPETLPTTLTGKLVNPDGSAAAGVRVRALEPSSVTTTEDGEFTQELPWPNPETTTDARGAFRLALPPRPLPDDGLELTIIGGNRITAYQLRRIDLVAGDGAVGVLPLDHAVEPLPRSVVAQMGDLVVRPTDSRDVLDNPEEFADPAPVITLGSGDCAVNFQSNSGVVDTFGYSMLVRLVAPELSGRRLGNRWSRGDDRRVLLSATTAGLTKYIPAEELVNAMGELGSWELTGRVPIEAPLDVTNWLDAVERNPRAVPKAATLGLGYIVKMHQLWIPTGLSLGDLVYSLPLAPGEQQRIAVSDERESLSVREFEALSAEEQQQYNERADSSTDAVFRSAFDESAAGGSKMKTSTESGSIGGGLAVGGFFGGIVAGLGIAGGYSDSTTTGSSSSWQNASRDYVSNASQDFHSALSRSAAARRRSSRTSVRLATASERKEVVTKVITNHNHNHALTMQYWQVLRHFAISSKVDDVQLVCFVPLELVQWIPFDVPRVLPTGTYPRDTLLHRYESLITHHDVLRSRLWWRSEYNHALDQLMAFAGNPTMTVQPSSGGAQDVVNVSITGTFLPFEDLWVTVVATSGARVGPVRMTGASADVAAGATTKEELLARLRSRRASANETRTAALALPDHIGRSNLARLEFSRAFRPFSYALTMPSGLSFTEVLDYLTNINRLNVTLSADELEREISGPIVADPNATINGTIDLLEAFNGAGGSEVMPVVMPVAAKRLPPVLSFADVLRIEALLQHAVQNTVEYSKAVWQSLTPEERAIMLEPYTIGVPLGGEGDATDDVPLLNCVANQVLGYFGNAAIMPFFIPPTVAKKVGYTSRDMQESLLKFHRQAYHPATSSITLPARGVLGEAVLGHCESSEKIDLTRFWNWQDSPGDQATDPATLAALFAGGNQLVGPAGAQAPSALAQGGSMVTINQGPTAMTPADLAAALIKSMPASNLPQDLTGIKELGAQMKVQTETTAESLNKTIAEASGLAKEAMKQVPEAIKAKQGAQGATGPGHGATGASGASGAAGSGATGGGGATGSTGTTASADGSPVDGGSAPA